VIAGLAVKRGGDVLVVVALGDSITYGFQPDKANAGARPSAFDTGYVDVFAARLRKLSPKIQVVNYGCPGESTVTFIRGGCPWLAEGKKLHDAFRGSQLKAALSVLRAHRGQVSPRTLTLWGNDLIPLSEKGKRASSAIASFASRLNSILQRLRVAAPTAEIIVTGAWNPEVDLLEQAQPLHRSLDAAIARAAAASRARVANTFAGGRSVSGSHGLVGVDLLPITHEYVLAENQGVGPSGRVIAKSLGPLRLPRRRTSGSPLSSLCVD
jgi:lysophospholipase L1-like esterase